MTYGKLADSIGYSSSVRAVGAAVGRNPITLIIPCHRVIGADGSLTGYAGGLERKRALLLIEKTHSNHGDTKSTEDTEQFKLEFAR